MLKKNMIRIVVICVALIMILSCFGCSMVTVNEEKRNSQVVATANGTDITYSQYKMKFDQTLYSNYGYTEDQFNALDEDQKKNIREGILKELVDRELEYQKAIEEGYSLTDEQTEELRKQFKDEVDNLGPNYRSVLEMGGKYSEAEMDKMVEEYVTMQLGTDFDWDKSFEEVCKSEVVGNYEADLKSKIEVTEDEIKDYYDLNVSNQQNMLNPKEGEQSSYALLETFGSDIYVYPDDVRRVQHLLIGFDEDTRNKILAYRGTDDAEADKLRKEALAGVKGKADEVYAKITAEKDMDAEKFAELMDEYGTDQSAVYGDNRLEGYIVHSYSSTNDFPQEFIDKALSMTEEGQISDMFESDYGYEILRLVSFPDPVRPLDDMHDTIKDAITKQKESQVLTEKRTELEEAADITYHYDRLAD